MSRSLIFYLIEVSGSMKGAYSRKFSKSKIESLKETIKK